MSGEVGRRAFLQCLVASPVAGFYGLSADLAQAAESVVRRRLRFTLTFINPLDRALGNQGFWCYLPASITASQSLRRVQVSMPHRLHDDVLGHRILDLAFDHFPALAQKVVTIIADVEMDQKRRVEILTDAKQWLQEERFIESDDSQIRALAAQLRRSTQTDTTRAIYEWIQGNVRYAGYLPEDLGALQALQHLKGDCTEFAYLVVALARANGIPARMVGGYVADRDIAPRPQDYHNWAEVYLEGVWSLVDAQKGNWLEPDDQYVAFRIYRDVSINLVGLAHRYRVQGDLQLTF